MHGALLIEKEELKDVKFVHDEVLITTADIKHRHTEFERAATLGNAHHGKVKIIFGTEDGLKEVETTVWAATEKYATLKGDIIIPVHAIHHIVIY
jgi:hypothetical protein